MNLENLELWLFFFSVLWCLVIDVRGEEDLYSWARHNFLRPQFPDLENNSVSFEVLSKSETQYFLWEESCVDLRRKKNLYST